MMRKGKVYLKWELRFLFISLLIGLSGCLLPTQESAQIGSGGSRDVSGQGTGSGQGGSTDTIAPSDISSVTHNAFSNSTSVSPVISWSASSDNVALDHYSVSIGTSAGATNVLSWTNVGLVTSKTFSGTYTADTTYYVNVRAVDTSSNLSNVTSSTGWTVDTAAPTAVSGLTHGAYSSSTTDSPAISWTATTDNYGVDHYEISIGTTSGATDTYAWTSIGNVTSKTVTGLTLSQNTTYYVNLRALDQAGNVSTVSSSTGWLVDTTAPSDPTVSAVQLAQFVIGEAHFKGIWSESTDAESGIDHYEYAIGTTSGGTDVVTWTTLSPAVVCSVGTCSKDHTGLTLSWINYYFSIKAINGAGLSSNVVSSLKKCCNSYALNFNQANSTYLKLTPTTLPVTTYPFSFGAWIYYTNTTYAQNTSDMYILSLFQANAKQPFHAIYTKKNAPVFLRAESKDSAGTKDKVGDSVVSDVTASAWHFVVGTFYRSGGKTCHEVYVDGGSAIGPNTPCTDVLFDTVDSIYIGASSDNKNLYVKKFFDGLIDEVAIWGAQLSQADVTRIYNAGVPIDLKSDTQSTNLKAWWRMGDVSGDNPVAGSIQDVQSTYHLTPSGFISTDQCLGVVPGGTNTTCY